MWKEVWKLGWTGTAPWEKVDQDSRQSVQCCYDGLRREERHRQWQRCFNSQHSQSHSDLYHQWCFVNSLKGQEYQLFVLECLSHWHSQARTNKWSTRVALSVEKRKWSIFAEREPLLSVMIKLPVIEFTGPPNISSLRTERRQKGLSNLNVWAKQFSWLPSWQESDPWCVNFFCERSLTCCEVFWPAGNAKWFLRVDCGWVYSQHCSQFGTIEPNRERIYWWPTDGWVKKKCVFGWFEAHSFSHDKISFVGEWFERCQTDTSLRNRDHEKKKQWWKWW